MAFPAQQQICAGKFTQLLKNYAGFSSQNPGGLETWPESCSISEVQEPRHNPIHEVESLTDRGHSGEASAAASCLRKFGVNLIFK